MSDGVVKAAKRGRWLDALVLILLAGLTCGVYGNALRNPFIIDDNFIILGDPRVQSFLPGATLTEEYWPPPQRTYLYRPFVSLSFVLNWALSHEAWAFRLPHLVLYAGTAFLLFLLARDLTRSTWAAVVAAGFFVVHPLHTGPINCVVDRAELAVGFFGLLAVWLTWRDLVDGAGRGALRPLLATLSLAIALCSKEHAVTLIGVVFVVELFARRTGRVGSTACSVGRRLRRVYLPLCLVVIGYLVVRATVLETLVRPSGKARAVDNIVAQPAYGLGPHDSVVLARWGTPLAVFGLAARLLAWPHPLSCDYSYAAIESVRRAADPRLWGGAALLVVAVGGLYWGYRRRSPAFVAIGICLVTYSIMSNTLVVISAVFAERFLYWPSIGWCLLLGVLGAGALRWVRSGAAWRRRGGGALLLTVLAVSFVTYCGLTIARNRNYRAQSILDAADLASYPRSARLLAAVAGDALNADEAPRALEGAQRAIAVAPELSASWRVAGYAHYFMGQPDQALEALRQSFRTGAQDEQSVILASDILAARGEYGSAIELLNSFLHESPRAATAQNNLAWYLVTAQPETLREPTTALRHAEEALRLRPHAADFVDTYVSVLLALGRREAALTALERVIADIPPDQPDRAKLVARLAALRAEAPRAVPDRAQEGRP